MPEITVIKTECYEFKRKENGISDEKTFIINDKQISSTSQSEIVLSNVGYLLADKGSRYGTFINISSGNKIQLEVDMEIEMGKTDFLIKSCNNRNLTFSMTNQEEEAKSETTTLKF